jgi:hypothetical protein
MKSLLVTVSIAAAAAALLVPGAAHATEVTDPGTQRDGMHACTPGFAMSGAHVSTNVFLCNDEDGALGAEVVDAPEYGFAPTLVLGPNGTYEWVEEWVKLTNGTQRDGMHACPFGSVMTGLQVTLNELLCAPHESAPPGATWTEIVDDGQTQRDGMHACPAGFVMTGIEVGENHFLCGAWIVE